MLYYRLYFMNQRDGHITRFLDFEAADDEAAKGIAARSEGEQPMELWCQGRKVQRFDPGHPSGAGPSGSMSAAEAE